MAGLALSIGLGALINAAWLLRGLKQLGSYVPEAGWGVLALRVAAAWLWSWALQWWLAGWVDGLASVLTNGNARSRWQGCLGASSAVVYFATFAADRHEPARAWAPV